MNSISIESRAAIPMDGNEIRGTASSVRLPIGIFFGNLGLEGETAMQFERVVAFAKATGDGVFTGKLRPRNNGMSEVGEGSVPIFKYAIDLEKCHVIRGSCVPEALGMPSHQARLNAIYRQYRSSNINIAGDDLMVFPILEGQFSLPIDERDGWWQRHIQPHGPQWLMMRYIAIDTLQKRSNIDYYMNPVYKDERVNRRAYALSGYYRWDDIDARFILDYIYYECNGKAADAARSIKSHKRSQLLPVGHFGKQNRFLGCAFSPIDGPSLNLIIRLSPFDSEICPEWVSWDRRTGDSERRASMMVNVTMSEEGQVELTVPENNIDRMQRPDRLILPEKDSVQANWHRVWNALQTNAVHPWEYDAPLLPDEEYDKVASVIMRARREKRVGPEEASHQAGKLTQMFLASPRKTVEFLVCMKARGLNLCPSIKLNVLQRNLECIDELLAGERNLDQILGMIGLAEDIALEAMRLADEMQLSFDEEPTKDSPWQDVRSLFLLTNAFAPHISRRKLTPQFSH